MAYFNNKNNRPMVSSQKGFSLIELVIVIVVLGIVVTAIAPILSKPFQAYDDTTKRVALVDAAESALNQMAADVRDAIPNTLRATASAIEFMPIRAGGRYRYHDDPSNTTGLTPSASDSSFETLGNLASIPTGARLVVYNTGATQFYTAATSGGLGIITPSSTTISVTDNGAEDQVSLSTGFQFDQSGNGSPGRRFYVATLPVSFVCDLANGRLLRFEGYTVNLTQPTNPLATPLSAASSFAVVAQHLTACNFDYDPGSNTRSGLLSLSLTLSLDNQIIELLHQVHVVNTP